MNADSPAEPSREELIALIAAQAAEIAALKAQIAELERRLGLNSSNSGKPPSSDGLKKPARVKSLREPSGKPPGGQKGHQGETLRQVAEPNRIVDHFPQSCATCDLALTPAMSAGHRARQVFDLPEPAALVVTEHRAHDCWCSTCGARTRASFPEGVNAPVQYGQRIAAFVTYLLHYRCPRRGRRARRSRAVSRWCRSSSRPGECRRSRPEPEEGLTSSRRAAIKGATRCTRARTCDLSGKGHGGHSGSPPASRLWGAQRL